MTLSDKINISYDDNNCNDILVKDVKEFIKKLKEYMYLSFYNMEVINRLAGDKLIS